MSGAVQPNFGQCHYCKRTMVDPRRRANLSATRDHVIPKCLGGRKTVKCCRHCNNLKGDMMPDRWWRIMRDYPRWWKQFRHAGELKVALHNERQAIFRQIRISKIQPAWPSNIRIAMHLNGQPISDDVGEGFTI